MKVTPSDKPTELTYCDLLNGLNADISNDTTIPSQDKQYITNLLCNLYDVLMPYSG